MKLLKLILLSILIFGCVLSCTSTTDKAELIITDGEFYTAEDTHIDALAIRGGRIIATGTKEEILKLKGDETQWIKANGAFIMPGLIEGHGHFFGLGQSQMELNFLKSADWEDIVSQVAEKTKSLPAGSWIIGRGWHQEKWRSTPHQSIDGYPRHDDLSILTPDHPVMLIHASGHSLIANRQAMALAGILKDTPDPEGGRIVRDGSHNPIGVFEENAMTIIYQAYNEYLSNQDKNEKEAYKIEAIRRAQDVCLKNGITSFQDAGSSFELINIYNEMASADKLDIRLWAMLRHSYDDMVDGLSAFPIINIGHHHFTCRAIKTELDGALGSYGAWLLDDYTDKPHFRGQNTTTVQEVDRIADLALKHDMQLCVHAIGDRANREVLDIMERKGHTQLLRWRMEHAQHLHPADIPRFKTLGMIASMQGIHCTSDAPFVIKRLGEKRAREGAYAWRALLDDGAKLANGTDVPVEALSPFACIYASITRKRPDSGLTFFPEQAMSRDEALKSYTIWNAYAAFEEDIKGSLEVGKLADIVFLSSNLLTCPVEQILDTKVLKTIVGGEIKYQNDK